MRKISFTVAAATTFTAAALGLAGTAVAAPTGGGNAADAVKGAPSRGLQRADQRECDRSVVRLRNHRRARRSSHYWELVHDRLCRRLVP